MNHQAPTKEGLLEKEEPQEEEDEEESVVVIETVHPSSPVGDELSDNSMLCTSDAATAPVYVIQYSMTAIVSLFVIAAVLTVLIARHYRWLLLCLWLLLLGFVIFLLAFVKETTTRKRVLHPNVYKFSSWMKQRVVDFVQDIQEDILLIANGDDPHKPRPPRSRLFRRFVRPMIHVFRRKRKDSSRCTQQQQQHQQQQQGSNIV